MWTQNSPFTLKQTIFVEMRKLGADYLEAEYSGGNDEGGINSVILFKRAAPRARKDVLTTTIKGTPTKVVQVKPVGDVYDTPLWEALDELLSIDFGSFAGEFNAYGTIFADVRLNEIWREGQTSHYSYDDDAGSW